MTWRIDYPNKQEKDLCNLVRQVPVEGRLTEHFLQEAEDVIDRAIERGVKKREEQVMRFRLL
jgi:hypothetical protein